ncbi:hypothetical protein ILT44_21305 [Microvirga sp. BT689]|uniref:DUF1796 family putative cysteine peptidase n=1 Tax=Microvirga arvi TaxID=2778731 RepID=UPI00194EDC6F|nr:DUF1796 family putative cysteine peptidase [Microvirga arvi]MBM6582747.1 hypothetical protein [Microvirga arvi]
MAFEVDTLAREQLVDDYIGRLESLGDNCELGFVLRRLGYEKGGFFRWVSSTPQKVAQLIKSDFHNTYRFENLRPRNQKMVEDTSSGISYHSDMHSRLENGSWQFIADEQSRRAIHGKEIEKLSFLLERFRERLKAKNTLFIVKRNNGIPRDAIEDLVSALRTHNRSCQLLEIKLSTEVTPPGRVTRVSDNLQVGYISRFAPYDKSDQMEFDQWISVIRGGLAGA